MPEMDGYATMAAIRPGREHAELPIIALTAKAMQGDREHSLSAGASDYVTKPVDTDHLLRPAPRPLRPCATRRRTTRRRPGPVLTSSGSSGAGGAEARILLVDDRPENLLALEAILSRPRPDLVRASSGEEALKALLTDDFAVILLDVQHAGDGRLRDGRAHQAPGADPGRPDHLPDRDPPRTPEHAFRGYAAGAVDYVAKPFDPWVLRAKVSVFVDLYEKRCQLQEQAALLRRRLATATGRRDLAAELSERLAAVEAPSRSCGRRTRPPPT